MLASNMLIKIFLILLLSCGIVQANTRDGLQGWYKLDDSAAVDSSWKGNNGTLTGTTLIPNCQRTSCRTFNGTSDYIALPDSAFNTQTAGSISAWVYANDVADATGRTIFINSNTADSNPLIQLAFVSSTLRIFMRNAVPTTQINASISVASGFTNVWTHVVYTMSASGGKLYINGVDTALTYVTGSSSTVYWFNNLGVNQYTIGASRRTTTTAFFQGNMDDVRFYNRALTAQEVKDLYNAGRILNY